MNVLRTGIQYISAHRKWFFAALCTAVLAGLYVVNPVGTQWAPKCVFRVLTGWSCPGCGLQRATHAFLHGHFAEAWAYNRFLIYSLPYLLCLMLTEWGARGRLQHRLRLIFESSYAVWLYILLFFAWGITRNVLGI